MRPSKEVKIDCLAGHIIQNRFKDRFNTSLFGQVFNIFLELPSEVLKLKIQRIPSKDTCLELI